MADKDHVRVDARDAGPDSIIRGMTTSAGAADGTTIVDTAHLSASTPSLIGQKVRIRSESMGGFERPITAFNGGTGTITVERGFPSQVGSGILYEVVGDAAGEVYKRLDDFAASLTGLSDFQMFKSEGGAVDRTGGRLVIRVSLIDVKTRDKVPAANIDIGSATITLYRSTTNGAFSTVTTQPTLTKGLGFFEASGGVQIADGEFAAGDQWYVLIDGVRATDSEGEVTTLPSFDWNGPILDTLDDSTKLDDIRDTRLGPTNAPSSSSGGANGKLNLLLDTYATVTGTADSGTTTTFVDSDRTEADGRRWEGSILVMTSGANDGASAVIADFDPATDTFTFYPAFANAVSAGDAYAIVPIHVVAFLSVALNSAGITIAPNSTADQFYVAANEQLRKFIALAGARQLAAAKSLVNALGSDGSSYFDEGITAILGLDNNNNGFSSANVTANRDGTILERSEAVIQTVGAWTGPTSGTFSMANNGSVQDIITVTGITTPTQVVAVIDLVNAGQQKKIVVQEKVDGTNYREIYPSVNWTTADEDGVPVEFTAQNDYKISIQNTGTTEAVSIPFRHSRRVTG